MKKSVGLLLMSLLLILGACGQTSSSKEEKHDLEHGEQHHVANGDLQESTETANVLPAFLDDKPEDMRLIYQAAGAAPDILEWMPCYCGCGESAGHGSNLNCFIDEIKEDGAVVWDDHGTRCLVCLEIAVQSIQMKQEGKSMIEIREAVDAKYGNGEYAKPTDTPMPV